MRNNSKFYFLLFKFINCLVENIPLNNQPNNENIENTNNVINENNDNVCKTANILFSKIYNDNFLRNNINLKKKKEK